MTMNSTAALLFLVAAGAVGLCMASCEGSGHDSAASTSTLTSRFNRSMPALKDASGWVNSAPLDLHDLRGKVVLVDFWTYTCINWRRTAPYLRLWAHKYKDAGLVV